MADQTRPDPRPLEGPDAAPLGWAVWLTTAWILTVLLSLVAVALDLENLALALDFQRHLN